MKANRLIEIIGSDYYTGVPDSLLRPLCDCIIKTYGIDPRHHIIAANEGNAVAIAAGYYLATGRVPVVYMQNSGEGNAINPIASLLSKDVYGIPVIFVIGWRGEPGIHDEPQHAYQGKITLKLLDDMNIMYFVIDNNTKDKDVIDTMNVYRQNLSDGRQVAFVIKKGALSYDEKIIYQNNNQITREEAIRRIIKFSEEDLIVCTTGKASRELFEIREQMGITHEKDFLTVGSMGHASSIALGIALQKPERRIWCIDGDGAALMHMGAMAVIGSCCPKNLIHIVINNSAHESVGGMPTVLKEKRLMELAETLGYVRVTFAKSCEELDGILEKYVKKRELSFVEVLAKVESRNDLGRPSGTPSNNKCMFMSVMQ